MPYGPPEIAAARQTHWAWLAVNPEDFGVLGARIWRTPRRLCQRANGLRFHELKRGDHTWLLATANPGVDGLALRHTRYDEPGAALAAYSSLRIVTLAEGQWGSQVRSSFAP